MSHNFIGSEPRVTLPNPFNHETRPKGLSRFAPGLATLRSYRREWLVGDLFAGLVLTSVLVPVGMSYALASGLPPIFGLYATIVPLMAYAIFGPSRILVLGPDSALAGIIAATILPLAAGSVDRAVALASVLAILSGLICMFIGLMRFGFITELLSKPIRYGYLNGIALTVLVGQLPKILGFSGGGNNFLHEAHSLCAEIFDGKIHPGTCAVGLVSLSIILVFKRWIPRVPGVLAAVVAAALVSVFFKLSEHGISVVGPMPSGMPALSIPSISKHEMERLAYGAVAIAIVTFADTSVLSRAFSLRHGAHVNANQELVALGASNIATGFFQGFPVSGSSSRTPVAEAAGAKTQLTSIIGALCVILLLLFAPNLLSDLPQAALGAVVVSACIGIAEVSNVARLYRLRRGEFVLSIVCFLGVALVGVIQGIFIAVGLALAAFVWRAWRPYFAVLGHVPGLQSYHDISRHPEADLIPGLVLFRWDAPLFFANAEIFHDSVKKAIARAPTRTKWVVVAAEPITDVDITAADMLKDLDNDLKREGIELCFAEMKGPVKDRLKHYGLFVELGTESFFPTLEQAVDRYQALRREQKL